tara:strand:- start:551 stop:1057 length:507 start_codon:yes stop_codon:yes gene_type:complete
MKSYKVLAILMIISFTFCKAQSIEEFEDNLEFENIIFNSINEYRSARDLGEISQNYSLSKYADAYADACAAKHTFSTSIAESFARRSSIKENLKTDGVSLLKVDERVFDKESGEVESIDMQFMIYRYLAIGNIGKLLLNPNFKNVGVSVKKYQTFRKKGVAIVIILTN